MVGREEMTTVINSATGVEKILEMAIEQVIDEASMGENDHTDLANASISAGGGRYLTRDRMLILKLANGSEYQLTIQRSEPAREVADDLDDCPKCGEPAYDGYACNDCGYGQSARD